IRLLQLNPGITEDPLSCQILTVRFIDAPKYVALSYVWGDATVTDHLLCDGKILNITLNLRDALLRMRPAEIQRLLWVDAVCINQQDNVEKGQQVRLMGLIY
ncbi:HET-domain-containing protein, partial [Lojkania enalia]